eukprot:257283-Rhodomonas_salina.1
MKREGGRERTRRRPTSRTRSVMAKPPRNLSPMRCFKGGGRRLADSCVLSKWALMGAAIRCDSITARVRRTCAQIRSWPKIRAQRFRTVAEDLDMTAATGAILTPQASRLV